MSFLDDVRSQARFRGPVCIVATLLAEHVDAAAEVADAIDNHPEVPATAIARALRARGMHVGAHSIARHRRGDCTCGRTP